MGATARSALECGVQRRFRRAGGHFAELFVNPSVLQEMIEFSAHKAALDSKAASRRSCWWLWVACAASLSRESCSAIRGFHGRCPHPRASATSRALPSSLRPALAGAA